MPMQINDRAACLGFIYGNRDFFPDQLVTEARADFAQLCSKLAIRMVQLTEFTYRPPLR